MNAFQFVRLLVYSQFFVTPPRPTSSFSDQTIIVTGSNTGIGFEVVKHLVRLDAAKIILAVRTTSKGDAAVQKIINEMECDSSRLEVWELDLANFDSIRAFVNRANGLDRLDAVCQNAGLAAPMYWSTAPDGTELTIKVNTLGAMYLAYAILPKMRESAQKTGLMGRLSLNGSDAMFYSSVMNAKWSGSLLEVLSKQGQSGNFGERYALSKALLFYAIRTLATQSPLTPGSGSNVLINVLTPGATKSEFLDREKRRWWEKPIIALLKSIGRETEVGARTLVHGIEPDLEPEAHGKFLMNSAIFPDNPMLKGEKAKRIQDSLEKELLPFLESVQPGVTKV